jgi:hypothetical protein
MVTVAMSVATNRHIANPTSIGRPTEILTAKRRVVRKDFAVSAAPELPARIRTVRKLTQMVAALRPARNSGTVTALAPKARADLKKAPLTASTQAAGRAAVGPEAMVPMVHMDLTSARAAAHLMVRTLETDRTGAILMVAHMKVRPREAIPAANVG